MRNTHIDFLLFVLLQFLFLKFVLKFNFLIFQGDYADLEEALLRWFRETRDRDIPVSGPILLQKASFFAEQLGMKEFKSSSGWLDKFKERHGITFKTVCGESKSVDVNSDGMDLWSKKLSELLKRYSPCDIYNADETALFYKLTPDKTLEFKNVDCKGGKRSKDRVTVLVCANMTGEDKLPLLVIGKAGNPRCFKNVKTLPTDYEHNKKAWMTSSIFEKWLQKLDKSFFRRNKKIAMVIDNCPAHPHVKNLKCIELVFLPPNTTSLTQPMDQGIIRNLKVNYRKRIILNQLDAMDKQTDMNITILDAMNTLKHAWVSVSSETIVNCYKHAKFYPDTLTNENKTSEIDDEDDEIPIGQLVEMYRLNKTDVNTFMDVDLDIPVCAETCETDIVNDLVSARNSAESEVNESAEDDLPAAPTPTLKEAITACETLSRFFEAQNESETQLNMICKLHNTLIKKDFTRRAAVQTTLDSFVKQ